MSEQDIKSCPCCSGGVGMVWTRHACDVSYESIISYKVQCRGCKLSTGDYATEPAAIAAWNQRAGCASCRDEAIAAALAVEQRNYDQAQELAKLRKLREVVSSFVLQDGTLYDCPVYVLHDPLNDTESFMGDMPDIVADYGAQEMGEALAACDEAMKGDSDV